MRGRTLTRPPSILPLYARAAAPLIPGASLLPFVPGRGSEMPDVELTLPDVVAHPDAVADYAKVCGFTLRDTLPPTYPHVLAFPLHMALMADGSFPFGAVGLVHLENRIAQRRPIRLGERLTLRVRATKLEPHAKGRTFSILSEAHVAHEKVWEETSTMLRRGGGSDATDGSKAPSNGSRASGEAPSGEWKLQGDLGRRYAAVSGDRNPIHMHPLTARLLGFPRAIAHGMWTKARALAALEGSLADRFAAEARFRRPILLPGTVAFSSDARGDEIDFAVRDPARGAPHLDGRIRPLAPESKATTASRRVS
jgi:acyl dehydratase